VPCERAMIRLAWLLSFHARPHEFVLQLLGCISVFGEQSVDMNRQAQPHAICCCRQVVDSLDHSSIRCYWVIVSCSMEECEPFNIHSRFR
jgi:hypothetical protein